MTDVCTCTSTYNTRIQKNAKKNVLLWYLCISFSWIVYILTIAIFIVACYCMFALGKTIIISLFWKSRNILDYPRPLFRSSLILFATTISMRFLLKIIYWGPCDDFDLYYSKVIFGSLGFRMENTWIWYFGLLLLFMISECSQIEPV